MLQVQLAIFYTIHVAEDAAAAVKMRGLNIVNGVVCFA